MKGECMILHGVLLSFREPETKQTHSDVL